MLNVYLLCLLIYGPVAVAPSDAHAIPVAASIAAYCCLKGSQRHSRSLAHSDTHTISNKFTITSYLLQQQRALQPAVA